MKLHRWNYLNKKRRYLLQSWNLTFKSKFSGGSIVDIRTSRDKGQLVTVQVGGREEEGSKREMRWWQKKKEKKSLLTTILKLNRCHFPPLLSPEAYFLSRCFIARNFASVKSFSRILLPPTPFCGIEVFVISRVIARIDPKMDRWKKLIEGSGQASEIIFFFFLSLRVSQSDNALSRFVLITLLLREKYAWTGNRIVGIFALRFRC